MPSPASPPVHWAITVTARPGKTDELDALLCGFVRRSLDDPGVTGVHLLRPAAGSGSREFQLLRSFQSHEHSGRFYESDMFREYQRQAAPLIEGHALIRPLHGFEAFFREGALAPARWKMAVLTWLAVFPSVLLVSAALGPPLAPLHPALRAAVSTAVMVVLLAWVIMPRLTRATRRWLRPGAELVYRGTPHADVISRHDAEPTGGL